MLHCAWLPHALRAQTYYTVWVPQYTAVSREIQAIFLQYDKNMVAASLDEAYLVRRPLPIHSHNLAF